MRHTCWTRALVGTGSKLNRVMLLPGLADSTITESRSYSSLPTLSTAKISFIRSMYI